MNQAIDPAAPQPQPPRIRILMVDDEEKLTRLTKLNLEREGRYEVRTENRAQAAAAAARAFQPDLVLLDVVMPDGDGGQAAADIRALPGMQNVPIIFLTATVKSAEVDAHAGLIGGQHFMAKPVKIEDLIACIEKHTRPRT
ncbi:MAG: response regulator [Kiritimatiellaeota bacterium]|nr:response regulator [Kiritimatiellota bacterium]